MVSSKECYGEWNVLKYYWYVIVNLYYSIELFSSNVSAMVDKVYIGKSALVIIFYSIAKT